MVQHEVVAVWIVEERHVTDPGVEGFAVEANALRLQFGPSGRAIYLTNITDAGAGVRDYASAGAQTIATVPPASGRFALRNQGGGSAPSRGAVDEWAVFNSERYSGTSYTCPTAPFTGAEADLVALYRCDGDTQDTVAA